MSIETPDRAVFSDLERELVRAARRHYAAVASVPDARPQPGGAGRGLGVLAPVLGAAVAIAVVVIAVSSLGHHGRVTPPIAAGPPGARIPVSARERSNERAARREAYRLLELVNVPPVTLPVAADVSAAGQGGISMGPVLPGNEVDAHSFWRVLGKKPSAVIRWIESHPPRGATMMGAGSSGRGGATLHWNATFGYDPIPGRISYRAIAVTTSVARGGGTAVRVDAQSVWVIPRPAASLVPDTVDRLEWSTASASTHGVDRTFTSRTVVGRLVAWLNAVPIARPVAGSLCYAPQAIHGFRFVLRSAGRATPTAVATWTGCGGVALDRGGNRYFLWLDTAEKAGNALSESFLSGRVP